MPSLKPSTHFLDGNARIGRLLIAALLKQWNLLPEPLMYLSGYLKQYQTEYYRRLSIIRTEGEWESWVAFFLDPVTTAASATINLLEELGIVTEMTGQKKNRTFRYQPNIELLTH